MREHRATLVGILQASQGVSKNITKDMQRSAMSEIIFELLKLKPNKGQNPTLSFRQSDVHERIP